MTATRTMLEDVWKSLDDSIKVNQALSIEKPIRQATVFRADRRSIETVDWPYDEPEYVIVVHFVDGDSAELRLRRVVQ